MEEMERRLRDMARGGIRLDIGGPAGQTPGAARFGGAPDVPPGFVWPVFETDTFDDETVRPRPLAFLAQFNCADLCTPDRERRLPETGVLSFFYELASQRWGFDPGDAGCCRVFWFQDAATLAPAAFPADLPEDCRLPPMGIRLTAEVSYPDGEDFFPRRASWADRDRFYKLRAALGVKEPEERSCLLGWPDILQGNMTRECELASRGYRLGSPEDYARIPQDLRRRAEEASLEEWRLLFQLDTVSRDGFELMFGDCGRIYFYIRKEDLAARRFDRVWLILQCC